MDSLQLTKRNKVGILLVLLAASSFAFKGVLAKLIFHEHVTIIALLLLRFLIATPLFWLAPVVTSKKLNLSKLRKKDLLWCFVCGFLFFISAFTDFKAISLIDVSVERVIFFSYPVFIIFFNSLINRSLPPFKHLVVFVVIEIGIMLVVGLVSKGSMFTSNLQGALWAISAAISYAFYLVIGQEIMKKIGSMIFTIIANNVTFLFLILYFLLFGKVSELLVPSLSLFYIVLVALFCTVIPFFMVFEGIKRIGANKAALLSMTGPIVTLFASYFILGENLDRYQIFGVLLVLSGVGILEGYKQCDV